MSDPQFLKLDEVLGIHADLIHRYGESLGLRDLGQLQSAVAMPETTFDDQFLGLNGNKLECGPDQLHGLVDGVASGTVDKASVAVFLRENCSDR